MLECTHLHGIQHDHTHAAMHAQTPARSHKRTIRNEQGGMESFHDLDSTTVASWETFVTVERDGGPMLVKLSTGLFGLCVLSELQLQVHYA